MSEEQEKMSINVYTNNKDSIMKSDNSTHEYIMKLNEEYNNNNIKLRFKVQELRDKIDNLEDENDRYDTSIRYMKGMIKNYVELRDLYKKMNKRRNELNKLDMKEIEKYKEYMKVYEHMNEMCLCVYYGCMFFYLYMGFVDYRYIWLSMFTLASSVYCLQVYYNINMYKEGKNINIINAINLGINEDDKNIKDIEGGNDFLDDYIDNL
jgi:hypothetical protein